MKQIEDIEDSIKRTLISIPPHFLAEGAPFKRTAWTRSIKEGLRALASRHDCYAQVGEWLYDLCWYRMTRGEAGFLIRLPLVVECEWFPDPEIDGDFQKLVQARADHRLWIFGANTSNDILDHFSACRKQIASFDGTVSGDRYLLAGMDMVHKQFQFDHIVV